MATTHYRCQMALENIQIQINGKDHLKKKKNNTKSRESQHLVFILWKKVSEGKKHPSPLRSITTMREKTTEEEKETLAVNLFVRLYNETPPVRCSSSAHVCVSTECGWVSLHSTPVQLRGGGGGWRGGRLGWGRGRVKRHCSLLWVGEAAVCFSSGREASGLCLHRRR